MQAEKLRAWWFHRQGLDGGHLGDMRAFSLDSPKSRRPRLDSLRAQARAAPH
jgi:hypothetical protein